MKYTLSGLSLSNSKCYLFHSIKKMRALASLMRRIFLLILSITIVKILDILLTSDFRRFEALIPPSQNDKTRDVVHLGNVWVLPQYIF